MTLRHLEIFMEVQKLGSVTGAADRLNMAQPAVSRVIRELESYYGVRLFERMNRKLYLTEAGKQLLSYADGIISRYYEARDVLRDKERTATLRIGSNISCAQRLVPELLKQFTKAYPAIPVCLKAANSQEIEKKLLQNELDFGFIDTPGRPDYFISLRIREDPMLVICARDYSIEERVTFEQFKKHPLLVREEGSGSRRILEQLFAQKGEQPDIMMESSDIYSLREMCRLGSGLLVMTESMAGSWFAGNEFRKVELLADCAKRSYCMVYHKSKYLTKSMRCFKEYAAGEIDVLRHPLIYY